jgi:uncharacterized protein (TIGR02996 family)
MRTASTELMGLLNACRAAPADDTPRWILADWLEEHGENDRAAFLRAQVELSHPTADVARTRQLKDLEKALLFANAEEWLGDLYRIAATAGRRSEYPSEVQELTAILDGKHKAVRFHRGLMTLQKVPSLNGWPETLDALRSSVAPWIECVEANYEDTYEFERCVYAPHAAGRLNATILSSARIQGYDSRQRPIITSIEPVTPGSWRRFVQCRNFPALRSLTLRGVDGTGLLRELGDEASRLVGLHIDCQHHLQEAAAIAARTPFHSLSSLSLGRLNTPALQTLCRSEHFRNLQTLNLMAQPIGDAGLAALCDSPLANTLRSVALQNTGIGDPGIVALARSPLFGRMHGPCLNLMMNRIGDRGLAAMADAPGLLRFREIVLRENQVGDEGVAALANSPNAANLAYLDFWRNRIGDAGAIALGESPHLNNVVDLSVKENRVGESGMLALQERFGDRAKY